MAGQAYTTAAVYADAAELGFNNSALLPPLNHAGSFGFAIRAGISPNIAPGEFLQYRSFPAAKRFALTPARYSDQIESWTYIANKAFPRTDMGSGGNVATNTGNTGARSDAGLVCSGMSAVTRLSLLGVWLLCMFVL
jgi:hypothetical protein